MIWQTKTASEQLRCSGRQCKIDVGEEYACGYKSQHAAERDDGKVYCNRCVRDRQKCRQAETIGHWLTLVASLLVWALVAIVAQPGLIMGSVMFGFLVAIQVFQFGFFFMPAVVAGFLK